jgi:NAD(P) transhydrogenase subunit alpha
VTLAFAVRLLLLVLASFLGTEVTRRVSAERRGPVMSLTTAMSGIVIVAAMISAGHTQTRFGAALGVLAVALAATHVGAAWLFSHRALKPADPPPNEPAA